MVPAAAKAGAAPVGCGSRRTQAPVGRPTSRRRTVRGPERRRRLRPRVICAGGCGHLRCGGLPARRRSRRGRSFGHLRAGRLGRASVHLRAAAVPAAVDGARAAGSAVATAAELPAAACLGAVTATAVGWAADVSPLERRASPGWPRRRSPWSARGGQPSGGGACCGQCRGRRGRLGRRRRFAGWQLDRRVRHGRGGLGRRSERRATGVCVALWASDPPCG